MLQTQLREARREQEQAAQQNGDDLAALREECRALLQAKTDLQEQVPPSVSLQPCSPSPAWPGSPAPAVGKGSPGPA